MQNHHNFFENDEYATSKSQLDIEFLDSTYCADVAPVAQNDVNEVAIVTYGPNYLKFAINAAGVMVCTEPLAPTAAGWCRKFGYN